MVEGCGGGTYLVLTAEGLWSQKMCRRTVQYVSSFCFSNVLAESFESFIKFQSKWIDMRETLFLCDVLLIECQNVICELEKGSLK